MRRPCSASRRTSATATPVRPSSTTTSGAGRPRTGAASRRTPGRGPGSASGGSRGRARQSLRAALSLHFLVTCTDGFGSDCWRLRRRVGSVACAAQAKADPLPGRRRALGLLTFDLDDTLFPVSPVVYDANRKMIAHMNRLGVRTSVAEFLETMRVVRQLLEAPVTYTTLRKMAVAAEMKRLSTNKGMLVDIKSQAVQECYAVWEAERHAAAERHLFKSVIPMLQAVKRRYPDTCIAAVTNGQGDPLLMPHTLADYFDFCISGEDDTVFPNRKPHAGIYEVTCSQYRKLYAHHTDDTHIWCHVGDCLVNDVGASAACGAYAIWFTSETMDKAMTTEKDLSQYRYSTATPQDDLIRKQQAAAVKDRAAVRITCLIELLDVIETLVSNTSPTGLGNGKTS